MGHSNRGQYNRKMKHFAIIFSLLQISLCLEGHDKCDGLCKLGEGDCNYDSDCVEGLKCDSDGWFGKDVCIAGPKTKNGFVTPWSEWSKCSNSACGTLGVISRYRSCIPPEFGGRECPPNDHTHSYGQHRRCRGDPCPPSTTPEPTTTTPEPTTTTPKPITTTTPEPTTTMAVNSKAACNPATWVKFSWACCTKKDPCYIDEGDCDNDKECAGDLVCGKNNCPETFTVRRGKNRPDCCKLPDA